MKKFLKEYWPFFPLSIIVAIAFLLIAIAAIGDIYSYWSISRHNVNYQSDNLYNDNSIR